MSRGFGEWVSDRWHARRYDVARGYDFPRWWRAREMRRLSIGAPTIVVHVPRPDREYGAFTEADLVVLQFAAESAGALDVDCADLVVEDDDE